MNPADIIANTLLNSFYPKLAEKVAKEQESRKVTKVIESKVVGVLRG